MALYFQIINFIIARQGGGKGVSFLQLVYASFLSGFWPEPDPKLARTWLVTILNPRPSRSQLTFHRAHLLGQLTQLPGLCCNEIYSLKIISCFLEMIRDQITILHVFSVTSSLLNEFLNFFRPGLLLTRMRCLRDSETKLSRREIIILIWKIRQMCKLIN